MALSKEARFLFSLTGMRLGWPLDGGGGERRCAAVRLRLGSHPYLVRATPMSIAVFLCRAGLTRYHYIHSSLPTGRIGTRGGGPFFTQGVILQGLTASERIRGQAGGATPRGRLYLRDLEDTGEATRLAAFRASGVLARGLAAALRPGPFGSSPARRLPPNAAAYR